MKSLSHLFENNRRWAEEQTRDDPEYFRSLSGAQNPRYMWIGCSDSRVPAEQIVRLRPGDLFVHRNVANVAPTTDPNCQSAIRFAVEALGVEHIIVCGHYGCGGIHAALGPAQPEPTETWLQPIRLTAQDHGEQLQRLPHDQARWDCLCELNVRAQVAALEGLDVIDQARKAGKSLDVHGWIYDLASGLLTDLAD